jgi:hypothetical protein
MKSQKFIGLLGVMILLSAGSAQAQFMPIQAKIRDTHQVIVSGKVIKSEVKEGNYYRSSDGSILVQWLTLNGERTWDGSLEDNKELNSYHLDYKQHNAFEDGSHPPVAVKPGGFASIDRDIGTDSVENFRCRILPAKLGGVGFPTPVLIGKSCVSPEYDLRLWTDVTVPEADGKAERTRTELYGITIGVEPDSSLFDIKSHFKIFVVQPANSGSPSGNK